MFTLRAYCPGTVTLSRFAISERSVRHAFSKYGGNLGTDGSVSYLFKKLGIIHLSKNLSEENLMEVVIESGAEDF